MNFVNLIKNKAKSIVGEENIEFLSHAKNYISAAFFTKALAFISVPIFTRLLSPDEYGILAIFTSIISISSIFLGLNFTGALIRYYHEEDIDFGAFITSNLLFLIILNSISFYFVNYFKFEIASLIGVNTNVFIFAFIISIFSVPFNLFLYYLRADKQSKKYSFISVVRSVMLLIISILGIYALNKNRYYGKIYSQLFVSFVFMIFAMKKLFKIGRAKFKFKFVKYSLNYGVPLIPHALSGVILVYFDRIAINQLAGSLDTGLYSFAYNVGMIMNVIVIAMNKAWIPIFFDNLKENNFKRIEDLANNYSKYIYFSAISLILFSREIVIILADPSYYNSLQLVPIIIMSYVLVFLYTLYANYAFYRKKTWLISIFTVIVAIINIVLNYYFIPKFGFFAAAYTTLFSYFLLFTFHYINSKFILNEKVISIEKTLYNFLIFLALSSIYLCLFNIINSYIFLLVIKVIIWAFSLYYYLLRN